MTEVFGERELRGAVEDVLAQDLTDAARHSDGAADLPPRADGEAMVVRSLRMPRDLDQRVREAARIRGIGVSAFVRELIEVELAVIEHDQPISRADALRALAALHPLSPTPAA